jgi:hypothetical protein
VVGYKALQERQVVQAVDQQVLVQVVVKEAHRLPQGEVLVNKALQVVPVERQVVQAVDQQAPVQVVVKVVDHLPQGEVLVNKALQVVPVERQAKERQLLILQLLLPQVVVAAEVSAEVQAVDQQAPVQVVVKVVEHQPYKLVVGYKALHGNQGGTQHSGPRFHQHHRRFRTGRRGCMLQQL